MPADLIPVLIDWCLRATALLGLAWALTSAMRRGAASTRHFLWTCAIAAAALVPATVVVVPDWRVASPAALATVSSVIAPVVTREQPTAPNAGVTPTLPAVDEAALPAVRPSATRTAALSIADIGIAVWAIGTTVVLLYMLVGFGAAWWLRRSTMSANARLVEDVNTLAEALEIPRPIRVVESAVTTMPLVCGVWRPLIVMPAEAARWPDERLRVVMLHELAHIKRRDCLTQALAQFVCAAYWFNPLAWIAARQLRAERERACDDFVLAMGTKGSEYAGHLLEIAQATTPPRFSPFAATGLAMARRSQLEGRLMAILDPAIRRSPAFHTRFAAAAIVVLISIPVAAVQLASPESAGAARSESATVDVALGSTPPLARQPDVQQSATSAGAAQAPVATRVSQDEFLRRTLNKTLLEFADEGNIDGVLAMLAAGADVNAAIDGDGSPLIAAAGEGHLDVVRLLLDKGADPNLIVPGDGTALIEAAGDGHRDVVALLLDKGADPNLIVPGDGTALIAAAGDGHTDVVDLLLQRGAQVNLIAEGDETALIQASGDGHLAVVKLLVSKGADVNLGVWAERVTWAFGRFQDGVRREPELRTPLSEARGDGHIDVVTFLISAGARD